MKDILKTHVFKVRSLTKPDSLSKAESTLGSLLGVMQVSSNAGSRSLRVSYNLKFVTYASLTKKLRDLGCYPVENVLESLKTRFISFTEKNEIQSQASPARRLTRPPGQAVKNHR
ncbi:MAG: hypothetical protein EPN93_11685 [Spirochaetes bacterium]|nr:MAG: hypothetical protein EPN93_11685 [Spirochaetota bacterium]